MENQLNTGTLDALKSGQTLLESVIQVNGGKYQIQIAERIDSQDAESVNLLALFNASDERFQRKPRKAWKTVEMSDLQELLGIDLTGKTFVDNEMGKPAISLNILNPVINSKQHPQLTGVRLRLQITESTIPFTQYDMDNIETRAKRKGKDGDFIYHQGQYIFTQTDVVLGDPKNTFLEADKVEGLSGIPANVDINTGEIFN